MSKMTLHFKKFPLAAPGGLAAPRPPAPHETYAMAVADPRGAQGAPPPRDFGKVPVVGAPKAPLRPRLHVKLFKIAYNYKKISPAAPKIVHIPVFIKTTKNFACSKVGYCSKFLKTTKISPAVLKIAHKYITV